jgi:hypothetical protein
VEAPAIVADDRRWQGRMISSLLMIGGVTLGLVAILLGAVELGYRQGRRAPPDDGVLSHTSSWEAALLGLMALLIGFTFAMAVSRFDIRRQLIVEEANAIEATALRSRYLDPPARDRIHALLVPYLETRIRFYDVGMDLKMTDTLHQQGKAWLHQLMTEVTSVARADTHSPMGALLMEGADELVKAEARRRAAIDNHVPMAVFFVVVMVSATGMAATGFACGLHRKRLRLGMILIPVLVAVVIGQVFDLDYPRAGFIRAGQGALLRLRGEL